jgi:L-arabinokinase
MKHEHHSGTIAYYITPHGFGHAVRSLEVTRCLLEHDPELEIILVSDIPEFLVEQNVGKSLPFRRKRLDVGLIQKDSLRYDLGATLEALQDLHAHRKALISEESAFLQSQAIDLVVADIPALPFYAASRSGIPSIGLGNFTWDWIYRDYASSDPAWEPLVHFMREGYGLCDSFLQLPMHGDCSACPRIVDVPLVTRTTGRTREEVRRILGFSCDLKAYLIAFGYLDLDADAQKKIEDMDGAVFFYKHPLHYQFSNGRSLDDMDLTFPEVVAAMDGVITKPGYGIIADCLAHGIPMIYSERGLFAEYDVLVHEMERHLTTVYMPARSLYAGEWKDALNQLETLTRRIPQIRKDGAEVCARAILERLKR